MGKSFVSYIRNEHGFVLTVGGFAVAVTWTINIRQHLTMVINSFKMTLKPVFTLRVKTLRLTFVNTLIKLTTKFTVLPRIPKIVVAAIMKQSMGFVASLNVKKIVVYAIMRMSMRIPSFPLRIPKVSIIATAVLARFNLLLTYDPQTLNALDSQTLATLDYSVAP
jgi:hypothetical protein